MPEFLETMVDKFTFKVATDRLYTRQGLWILPPDRGRVLGVHLMGPHATDLIAEGALAVQMGATADDLAWTTHAHPTLPEAMLEAALGFRDATLHFHSR